MPAIKIHPPKPLPEQAISEQEFQDWQNELEIWLGEDDNMARFMTGGRYHTWQSQEQFPHRIADVHPRDPDRPAQDVNNREDLITDLLAKRRRQLKTFLGQIAKCTSRNMYATIVRHAMSLEWIYTKIRQDYDIQQKGIHFLNIIDLKYDAQSKTPASFYNEYRTVILNNVGRQDERIHYLNQDLPADDEWAHFSKILSY